MASPAENKSPNAKDHPSSPITEASLDIDCLGGSGGGRGGGGGGETPTHEPRSRKRSAPEAEAEGQALLQVFPDSAPNSRTLPSSHRALAYPVSSNDSQQQIIDIEEEEEYYGYDREVEGEDEKEEEDCTPFQEITIACDDSLLISLADDDDDDSTNSSNKYTRKLSFPADTDHPTAAFFDDLAARGSIYRYIVQK
jgi:hypothetical protein